MITHGLQIFSLTIAPRQLSAFRRRQPDLLTLPTLSVNDVANLIAMEVEKRGYEGVGALEVWKYHEMPVADPKVKLPDLVDASTLLLFGE